MLESHTSEREGGRGIGRGRYREREGGREGDGELKICLHTFDSLQSRTKHVLPVSRPIRCRRMYFWYKIRDGKGGSLYARSTISL